MRFLVYTLLFLVFPLVGFTQVKQANAILNTDTNKVLERGGYTPPPEVDALAYDVCTGAVLLATAPSTTAMPSSATATNTVGDPSPSCSWGGGLSGTDFQSSVWFKYTTTTAGTLTVTLTNGTMKGAMVVLYNGICGNFTQLACNKTTSATATGVTATASASSYVCPGTYYIMVAAGAAGGTYTVSTAFNSAATPPAGTPANNCCTSATDVTSTLNGSTSTVGTTSLATSDGNIIGNCNSGTNNVWYSFVAQGPDLEITATGTSSPEFVVLPAVTPTVTGSCATTTSVMCASATSGTATANNITGTALVTGNTYYISVTTTVSAGGTFTINVHNPPLGGTDCATAALICKNTGNVFPGNTNLWGAEELNTSSIADCIGTNGEYHSAWYVIHAVTSGNLTFTISPSISTDNYDFALFYSGTANSFPAPTCTLTPPVSCNSSTATATLGRTGLDASSSFTSQSASGTQFNQQVAVSTDDVYLLMVNSPLVGSAYSITLGSAAGSATYTDCADFPVILPVQLVDFTATQNGNEVDLKWSTASETNNSYFTIERSANGKNFEELSKVNSETVNGNSTNKLEYSDIDYAPLAGISYYRLSQTDLNGKITPLVIIPHTNKENDGAFAIAPNPTDGTLNISYSCQTATIGTLKIFDSNGSLFLEQNLTCSIGDSKIQLDLSDKPNGIYFVTFTTNTSFYRNKLLKK